MLRSTLEVAALRRLKSFDIRSLDWFVLPIRLPITKDWLSQHQGATDISLRSQFQRRLLCHSFIYGGEHSIELFSVVHLCTARYLAGRV